MCLAIPGQILSIDLSDPESPLARVDFGLAVKQVSLLYTPEAGVGSFVVVHAGFATRILPESEAREALEYARQWNEATALAAPSAAGSDAARVPVE